MASDRLNAGVASDAPNAIDTPPKDTVLFANLSFAIEPASLSFAIDPASWALVIVPVRLEVG